MPKPRISRLAGAMRPEMAFSVLSKAREWKQRGKEVVELEIGDSPFPGTSSAKAAGIRAITENHTGYGPSLGLPILRNEAARMLGEEWGISVTPENIAVTAGAKPIQQFFAEAVLEPDDGVLIFSPHFPTYEPNLHRRGARAVLTPLLAEHQFRPQADAVRRFVAEDPQPRAIILNSPHNPTGGVATFDDLQAIADLAKAHDLWIFSDEPYSHMVWNGRHTSILQCPGMLDRVVAGYTFSKSYSMSGWRIGFAAAHPDVIAAFGVLMNTAISCVPPFVQIAAAAALRDDRAERDALMDKFRIKVEQLSAGLAAVPGFRVVPPQGAFYVFPDVRHWCREYGISAHGLALFLLEAADDRFGVACLGGECFGSAGEGFLRFSCAETPENTRRALDFLPDALRRRDRVIAYLKDHPEFSRPAGA